MSDPTPAQSLPVAGYDAFVSYRSASSGRQARQLDRALFHLGKRHRTDRAPNVFLDTSDLVAGTLNEKIERALDVSRSLVVLLDSTTKESPWVAKEIEYWLANGGAAERLFLVRTDPALNLSWDRAANGFARPDELPTPLRAAFAAEQKYFDLPRSRSVDESSLVGLYSAVMNVEPETLLLEESQYQRSRRRRSTVLIGVLAVLLVVAAGAGIIARQQSRRSEESARAARGEAAASGALLTLPYSYPDAIDQALTASTMSSSQSVRSALIAVANGTGALRRTLDWSQTGTGRPAAGVAFSTDGSRLMAWGPAKDSSRSHLAAWSVVSGEKTVDNDIAASGLSDVREVGAVGYVGCSAKGPVLIDRRTYSVLALMKPAPSAGDEVDGCRTLAFAGGVVVTTGGEGTSTAPGTVFVSYAGRHIYFPGATPTRVNPQGWSVPLISGNRLTLVSARGQASVSVPDEFSVRFATSEGMVLATAGSDWYQVQHSSRGTSAKLVKLPVPGDTAEVAPYSYYGTTAGYAWITRSGVVGWSKSAETVQLTDDTQQTSQRSTYAPAIMPTGSSGFFASLGGAAYSLSIPDFGHGWIARTLSVTLGQPDVDGASPVTSYCDSGAAIGLASDQWLVNPLDNKSGLFKSVSTEARLDGCTLIDPGPPLAVNGIRITDGTASSADVAVSDGSPGGIALFRAGGVIQLFATAGRVENAWRQSTTTKSLVSALGERTVVAGDGELVSLGSKGERTVLGEVDGSVHVISPDGLEAILSSSQFDDPNALRLIAGRGGQTTIDRQCRDQWPTYVPGPRFESDIGDAEKQYPAALTEAGWLDCRSGQPIGLDQGIGIQEYEIGADRGRIVWSRTRDKHIEYQVTTWNRGEGAALQTRKLPMTGDQDSASERASLDPSGDHLLVSNPVTPAIRSYTWSDGQWKAGRSLQAAIGDIQATAWSRDASLALAVGDGGGFELYDMATGRRLITQVGSARDPSESGPAHIDVTESDGFLRAHLDGSDPALLEIPIDLGRLRELLCVVHHATACGPGPGG
ncbi:toll/interleukin-1 receptor domain-containing protein [Kribbella sp. NBC_00709]|uniref:toll/interleukin-1 receptor domain-containing protein n=1 Tax=Kribbella sp. NBC_00709 TaxID=2975972 RepID=UPI002E2821B6|nr:toll/interleukin-1 receptor domain-containing protein [Kribbella sp. NBC_00709]